MSSDGKNFLVGPAQGTSALLDAKITQAKMLADNAQQGKKSGNAGALGTQPQKSFEAKKMEDTATQFEALLLQQMLQSMWGTVPKDEEFGSQEEDTYRDMYSEALAKNISENQSLGIKSVILKEFQKAAKK